jgi:hypothetical protein
VDDDTRGDIRAEVEAAREQAALALKATQEAADRLAELSRRLDNTEAEG